MSLNVPLIPRQASGSSSDQPNSPPASESTSPPAPPSTQSSSTPTQATNPQSSSPTSLSSSTSTQATDPQSSSPTSLSTTSSTFTSFSSSATSAETTSSAATTSSSSVATTSSSSAATSSSNDLSTSSISSSVTITSSVATSTSLSPSNSGVPTLSSPSSPLPTSVMATTASSPPATSVANTGVSTSPIVTTVSSSPSPTPPSPPQSSAASEPSASSPPLSTSASPPTSTGSGNPSTTTAIITSTSIIASGAASTTFSALPPPSTASSALISNPTTSSDPFSLTAPITFTTTDSTGRPITTVPESFTSVFATTRSNGEATTMTQIVVNPTGILSPPDSRSQAGFFGNKGAVAGVFLVVGLAATAIVVLGMFAIWKRRQTRLQRDKDLATGARGASHVRLPLEPEEAGQDHGIYAVATRHSPVAMRSVTSGSGPGEESGSLGSGRSVLGSAIPLNPFAPVTNSAVSAVSPEQQPHPYYPYFPSEARPSFPRVATEGSRPPAYSALHPYLRVKTPSPVFGGPSVSAPGPSTGYTISGQGAPPPSPYTAAIFSGSRQPSSEGHGSSTERKRGLGLASMGTPSGQAVLSPRVAYAYEPEPVTWSHRIIGASPAGSNQGHTSSPSPRNLQASAVPQDSQSNGGSTTNLSASIYSQDWEPEPEVRPTLRVTNDPRISPELGMRLRGGLASEHSFGPRDDEDWTRRVGAQMIANDSTLQVVTPAETHPPEG